MFSTGTMIVSRHFEVLIIELIPVLIAECSPRTRAEEAST